MKSLSFLIPIQTVSEANQPEHWAAKARRAKGQRIAGCVLTPHGITVGRGLTITLTRIGPRKLDSDNLAISQKHLRDGIADALGIDDGDKRLIWKYAQRKGASGVLVHIRWKGLK